MRGPSSVRWLAPAVLLLLAGCTAQSSAGPAPMQTPPPFGDCAALTAPPTGSDGSDPATGSSPAAPSAGGAAGATAGLPDLTLPCFTGERPFRLAQLRGPAVLNLWGTWCPPCRDELPAMQRLADRTAGRLHVVGVNTWDGRDAAGSFGTDKGITMATLYDPEKKLATALGKVSLPVTVFVDMAGSRYVYNGTGLDDVTLARLVAEHTGVTVQP